MRSEFMDRRSLDSRWMFEASLVKLMEIELFDRISQQNDNPSTWSEKLLLSLTTPYTSILTVYTCHYELDPSSSSSEPKVDDSTSARFNKMEEEEVKIAVIAATWMRWSYCWFLNTSITSCLLIFANRGSEFIFLFNISIWFGFIADFNCIRGEKPNASGFRL